MRPSRSRLTIELNEEDVQKDVAKVVSAMSKIRGEASVNTLYTDKQKDEYLHLSYRLASAVKGIASQDTIDRMDSLAKEMDKDERLVSYDYFQENYWKKHNLGFSTTLDKVVISIMKDDFNNLEAKHHVLQAIKFLGVSEAPFEEKEKIYATILPFNGKVKGVKKNNKLVNTIKRLFGYSYKIEEDTDLRLRVRGNPEFLPDLIEEARDLGYSELEAYLYNKDFEELKKNGLEGTITGEDVEKDILGINKQKLGEVAKVLLKATVPISYPLIGSLPGDLQERIEKNTTCNPRVASITSNWCGFVGGLGLGITNWAITGEFLSPLTLSGFYTAIESAVRGMKHTKDFESVLDVTKDKLGRLPLLPITYPIKFLLNKKDSKGSYVRALFKLKNVQKTKPKAKVQEDGINMFDYFNDAAKVNVPQELEDNLVWNTSNHNNYGKDFASYLANNMPKDKKATFETSFDRKNQKYNLTNVKNIDGYDKVTMLAFSKGERYILSFINTQNSQNYLATRNEILANNATLEEKAKELTTKLNVTYMHLVKIENNNVIGDYKVTN